MHGAVIAVVIVLGYLAFAATLLGWMRGRLRRRAEAGARALEATGARVRPVEMTAGWGGMVASAPFVLDGVEARYAVRQYGRDFIAQSVVLPHAPLPAVLVRAERGIDRFGKRLGLNREVQTGDADFDAAAYVETSAPDEIVRGFFADVRMCEATRALLTLGYALELSAQGLAATRVRGFYADFEAPEVATVLRALAAVRGALPEVDPALAGTTKRWVPWGAFAVLFGGYAVIGASTEGHPLWDPSNAATGFVFGAVAWVAYLLAVGAVFRGRSDGLRRALVYGFVGALVVPFLGALTALAVNVALDGGAAESRDAVVLRTGRGHHVTIRTDAGRVSVPVSSEFADVLRPGSRVRVRCHPGALGWAWIEAVTPVSASSLP
jgi:hypothetical protein